MTVSTLFVHFIRRNSNDSMEATSDHGGAESTNVSGIDEEAGAASHTDTTAAAADSTFVANISTDDEHSISSGHSFPVAATVTTNIR